MIAVIHRLEKEPHIGPVEPVFEIKIKDIIYQQGYDGWKPGDVTALVESDLKKPKEVVRFMFEEI